MQSAAMIHVARSFEHYDTRIPIMSVKNFKERSTVANDLAHLIRLQVISVQIKSDQIIPSRLFTACRYEGKPRNGDNRNLIPSALDNVSKRGIGFYALPTSLKA